MYVYSYYEFVCMCIYIYLFYFPYVMINNICAFKCTSTNVDSVLQRPDPTGGPDLRHPSPGMHY